MTNPLPEACRRAFNDGVNFETASDAALEDYADHYYQYNPVTRAVTREVAAVCDSCPGGGTSSDIYLYTQRSGFYPLNLNSWSVKTVQTMPTGVQRIVYSNHVGLPILHVYVDGSSQWYTWWQYDQDTRIIVQAESSAITGFSESFDDLVDWAGGTYVLPTGGLLHIYNYNDIDTSQGQLAARSVRQGKSGGDVVVEEWEYSSNTDSNGNVIDVPAQKTVFPVAGGPGAVTAWAYTYHSGTNQVLQRTTTLPAVSTAQNGSGTSDTIVEEFDVYGNRIENIDENGNVNNYACDIVQGVVTQQVLNVQSGVTAPGVNVTSDFTYDDQGRPLVTLGPAHTVVIGGTATTVRPATYNVYLQSTMPGSGAWNPDQTWTGQGNLNTGTSAYSLVNPVTILKLDKDGRTLDRITSKRTTGSGALAPTDTFAQTDWKTWVSTQYDNQHRTIGSRTYFRIPRTGEGTVGVNYGQTTYGYDALERKNRNVAAGGTITRTVWQSPQWVQSVWTGTNDTGATDSDPTGGGAAGNNMVMVTANQYDNGSAGGDGNLTRITRYVSGTTGDTRVMYFSYDFRNRMIGMTDSTGRYYPVTLDNLGRVTQSQGYSSFGGTLFAQKQVKFDDRGRVYQTLTYAVNVTTGAVGNALIGNKWFDPCGNLIQSIAEGDGQAFTKQTYNGVNWVLSTYRGYNTGGVSYAQAMTVANDIIVEQNDKTFDEAGNIVSLAISQRLNDAPATGSGSTGALTYGTQPKARVSYVANWFDGIDRSIASANYGAISSFTRPATPPASSATILVTQSVYNDAGEAYQSIDAMGNITQTAFDDAARTTQTVEAFGTIAARTTQFLYTLDHLVSQMIAKNPITGDQVTTWDYGTTLASSGVARNDLLASVAYPDSVSGSDVVSYAYNRQGEQRTIMDQRGTVRTFYRDLLGRLTNDCVTTVGSNTDSTVLQIMRGYDIRGMVNLITSTDSAAQGAGTILNQVAFAFNDFRQLITDQQSHSGAVTSGTPSVQYAYDDGASSSNEIRLNELTYPNSRAVSYNFASGMDAILGRVTSISDTSATLASYTYLGAGTVIRITYPEPGIWLDLWGGTSGVFAGIDQFGRIIDQRWQNNITGTPTDIDRYKYGYDQNSNRLYKNNVVGTAAVSSGLDEFYAYDPLNRLTDMQRGVLNGTNTGISGTPSVEQDWTLDPMGNWSNFITKAAGTTNLDQTRTANTVNEITNITESTGPTWVVPDYDAAGNTITMPQVVDPTLSFTAVYDAWNRMVGINGEFTPVGQYQYDGRNFRIVKETYTGGTLTETRDFYFTANWQDIEEDVSGSMEDQYVWGIRYIDELVCRDDATPERLYAAQDANFNLTSISNMSGGVVERYLFDPYGLRTIMNAAWGVISASSYDWTVGQQGLMYDMSSGMIYNRTRNRPQIGGFTCRDGKGYVGGANLYEQWSSNPLTYVDPLGADNFNLWLETEVAGRSWQSWYDSIGSRGQAQQYINKYGGILDDLKHILDLMSKDCDCDDDQYQADKRAFLSLGRQLAAEAAKNPMSLEESTSAVLNTIGWIAAIAGSAADSSNYYYTAIYQSTASYDQFVAAYSAAELAEGLSRALGYIGFGAGVYAVTKHIDHGEIAEAAGDAGLTAGGLAGMLYPPVGFATLIAALINAGFSAKFKHGAAVATADACDTEKRDFATLLQRAAYWRMAYYAGNVYQHLYPR